MGRIDAPSDTACQAGAGLARSAAMIGRAMLPTTIGTLPRRSALGLLSLFFVSGAAQAILLTVVPLEALHLLGSARAVTLLYVGAGLIAVVLFTIGGVWTSMMQGYHLVSGPDPALAQTPLQQTVERAPGAWLTNFHNHRVLWLIPTVGYLGILVGVGVVRKGGSHFGWWMGALAWIGILGTVGAAMFPFMLPSSTEPSQSLTVWNASSSRYTLGVMLGFTVVFMPLIIWYTSWAFWVMRGKVSTQHVESDEHAY